MTPLNFLLDIAPYPRPVRPIRRPVIPDTVKPVESPEVPDTTDTIVSATDTITSPTDSINALVGNFGSTTGGDDTTTLFWTVLAVLFALCVCFYFVLSYRRMGSKRAYFAWEAKEPIQVCTTKMSGQL